jgi:hypothetical protein
MPVRTSSARAARHSAVFGPRARWLILCRLRRAALLIAVRASLLLGCPLSPEGRPRVFRPFRARIATRQREQTVLVLKTGTQQSRQGFKLFSGLKFFCWNPSTSRRGVYGMVPGDSQLDSVAEDQCDIAFWLPVSRCSQHKCWFNPSVGSAPNVVAHRDPFDGPRSGGTIHWLSRQNAERATHCAVTTIRFRQHRVREARARAVPLFRGSTVAVLIPALKRLGVVDANVRERVQVDSDSALVFTLGIANHANATFAELHHPAGEGIMLLLNLTQVLLGLRSHEELIRFLRGFVSTRHTVFEPSLVVHPAPPIVSPSESGLLFVSRQTIQGFARRFGFAPCETHPACYRGASLTTSGSG